eukprot:6297153-Prymnesium_polylepis.1
MCQALVDCDVHVLLSVVQPVPDAMGTFSAGVIAPLTTMEERARLVRKMGGVCDAAQRRIRGHQPPQKAVQRLLVHRAGHVLLDQQKDIAELRPRGWSLGGPGLPEHAFGEVDTPRVQVYAGPARDRRRTKATRERGANAGS